MFSVGLSGGIGSGKSSVAKVFMNLGIAIYSADIMAKLLMNSNKKLQEDIQQLLGKEAYCDSELQRAYVASIVFDNPEILKKLNAIVHPAVLNDYVNWQSQQNSDFTIQENALMFSSDSYKKFDKTIYVYCPEKIRVERVCKRDSVTPEEVVARITNQAKDSDCIAKADFVITNDNSTLIIPQIIKVYNDIKEIIYG